MFEQHARYLPLELVGKLSYLLDPDTKKLDLAWEMARLLEAAYAEGYRDGHLRGYQAGRDAVRREDRDRKVKQTLMKAVEDAKKGVRDGGVD